MAEAARQRPALSLLAPETAKVLDHYAPTLRAVVGHVIRESGAGDVFTPATGFADLRAHVGTPDGQVWLVLNAAGQVQALLAARVAGDTAVMSWAWSRSRTASRMAFGAAESWAAGHGVRDLLVTRVARPMAFQRLLRAYGFTYRCVVFSKRLCGAEERRTDAVSFRRRRGRGAAPDKHGAAPARRAVEAADRPAHTGQHEPDPAPA